MHLGVGTESSINISRVGLNRPARYCTKGGTNLRIIAHRTELAIFVTLNTTGGTPCWRLLSACFLASVEPRARWNKFKVFARGCELPVFEKK